MSDAWGAPNPGELTVQMFTLLDVITNCPPAEWEPGVGGSARTALDAWCGAAMQGLT